MKKSTISSIVSFSLLASAVAFSAASTADTTQASEQAHIEVTAQNFSHAETSRMYRNWIVAGNANNEFFKMQNLPPRGDKAPTVQMNDDTLYGVAIVNAVDGKVTFNIPKTDNYVAVQVITKNGHGEHYVVDDGTHEVSITDSDTAFILYRSGLENGIEEARASLDKVDTTAFNFATDYTINNYDFDQVMAEVNKRKAIVDNIVEEHGYFEYTFPRTPAEVTDLQQWNLENAAGWGGASPIALEGNKYSNSPKMKGDVCYTSTFDVPENKYFTSVTAYDSEKFLMEGVKNVSSNSWVVNKDNTVTVSFNCGDDALNNIDTLGNDYTFTTRNYGVSQAIIDAKIDPIIKNVKEMK